MAVLRRIGYVCYVRLLCPIVDRWRRSDPPPRPVTRACRATGYSQSIPYHTLIYYAVSSTSSDENERADYWKLVSLTGLHAGLAFIHNGTRFTSQFIKLCLDIPPFIPSHCSYSRRPIDNERAQL